MKAHTNKAISLKQEDLLYACCILYFTAHLYTLHLLHMKVFLIQEVRVLLLSNLEITNYESLHLSCEVPHDFHTPTIVPPVSLFVLESKSNTYAGKPFSGSRSWHNMGTM